MKLFLVMKDGIRPFKAFNSREEAEAEIKMETDYAECIGGDWGFMVINEIELEATKAKRQTK